MTTQTVDGRWAVFGRKVHPFALGATVALVGVSIGPWYDRARDAVFEFDSAPGIVMAVVAAATAVLFFVAWVLDPKLQGDRRLVRAGFLLTAGIFTARATLGLLTVGASHPAVWISTGVVVASIGAWAYERMPAGGRR